MSSEQSIPFSSAQEKALRNEWDAVRSLSCELDAQGHCITCSDEALQARVLRVDEEGGVAFVVIDDRVEEVDIMLLDEVVPGNLLLVHGGTALARVDTEAIGVDNG